MRSLLRSSGNKFWFDCYYINLLYDIFRMIRLIDVTVGRHLSKFLINLETKTRKWAHPFGKTSITKSSGLSTCFYLCEIDSSSIRHNSQENQPDLFVKLLKNCMHSLFFTQLIFKINSWFYIFLDCQMLPRGSVHTSWSTPKHQGDPNERPHGRGQLGPAKQEP